MEILSHPSLLIPSKRRRATVLMSICLALLLFMLTHSVSITSDSSTTAIHVEHRGDTHHRREMRSKGRAGVEPFITAGGWDVLEKASPGKWPVVNGEVLPLLHRTGRAVEPIISSGGCAALVQNSVFIDVQQGISFFHRYSGMLKASRNQQVAVPFCSIAALDPVDRVYPVVFGAGESGKSSKINDDLLLSTTCDPLAVISTIERPQHAAHMMWSVLGVVALQVETGVDYTATPVHLTLQGYGMFTSYTRHFRNLQKFPHLELLSILSKKKVELFVDSGQKKSVLALDTLIRPDPLDIRGVDGAPQDGSGQSCYDAAVFGNIPLRIPRQKKPPPYMIKPHHFAELRRRLISHFGLVDPSSTITTGNREVNHVHGKKSHSSYALLITRAKKGRRLIVNKNELADALRRQVFSPRGMELIEVDWEGMPLKDQLQLAVFARAMIGMHGNGMAWAPLMMMPPNKKNVMMALNETAATGVMVEIGSDWVGQDSQRNEVYPGINEENPANVAKWSGHVSLSLRAESVENKWSRKTTPTRRWKEMDVLLSENQITEIKQFLSEHLS